MTIEENELGNVEEGNGVIAFETSPIWVVKPE